MQLEAEWNDALKRYTEKYPKEAEEFQNLLNGNIPSDWDKVLPVLSTDQSSTLTLNPVT
jgi:transketolase